MFGIATRYSLLLYMISTSRTFSLPCILCILLCILISSNIVIIMLNERLDSDPVGFHFKHQGRETAPPGAFSTNPGLVFRAFEVLTTHNARTCCSSRYGLKIQEQRAQCHSGVLPTTSGISLAALFKSVKRKSSPLPVSPLAPTINFRPSGA